jgi:hypothetical protein
MVTDSRALPDPAPDAIGIAELRHLQPLAVAGTGSAAIA